MTAYSCSDCNFRFEGDKPSKCPRCEGTSVSEFQARGTTTHSIRDGKEGWQDFHSQQQRGCPHCGGNDFELNYKRKEKVCRKCGEVLPLPRRFA